MTPPNTWLLALMYVCYLLNHTYNSTVHAVPLQLLHGHTVDISPVLRFNFWQHVAFADYKTTFPSKPKERTGRFVDFSEHVGHALCYKILTDDTQKIIHRSSVRPLTDADPNLRSATLGGEDDTLVGDPVIKSRGNHNGDQDSKPSIPSEIPESTGCATFDPHDVIGRTFLMDEQEDGQ